MEDQKLSGDNYSGGAMRPPQVVNNASQENVAEATSDFLNPESVPVWDFIKQCYEGSGGFLDGKYLFPFKRDAYYNTRRQMTKYVNLFKPAIDASIDPIFNNEITRTLTGKGDIFLNDFVGNVNGAGLSLTNFLRDFAKKSKLWSMCHAVVFPVNIDEDESDEEESTAEENTLPYVKIIEPQTMVSIDSEEAGYATAIRWKISDTIEQEVNEYSFVEYTRLKDKDGKMGEWTITSEVPHGLGYAPIVQLSIDGVLMREDELPQPTMLNIVNLCLEHFNTKSLIAIQKRFQSFSILRGSGIEPQTTDIGVSNLIIQSNDATIPLDYISPNVACLQALFDDIDKTKTDIREAFKQLGVVGVVDAKSGIAKEWDFRAEEAVLKSGSLAVKNATIEILSTVADYLGFGGIKIEIEHKDKFAPDTTTADVELLRDTYTMVSNQELRNEIEKEIALKLFAHKPERVQELLLEMDASAKTKQLANNGDGEPIDLVDKEPIE